MLCLVAYDIADDRRRYRIDRLLKGYGRRVQKSLFECHLKTSQLNELQSHLTHRMDERQDSILICPLCGKDSLRVRVQGRGEAPEAVDYFLV